VNAGLSAAQMAELTALIEALLEERITPEDASRLDQFIRRDEAARWVYVQYTNLYAGLCWDRSSRRDQHVEAESHHAAAPIAAPIHELLGHTTQSTLNFITSGWALAYVVATVILGTGLLIAAITHVSKTEQVVQQNLPSPFGRGAGGEGVRTADAAQVSAVGQITGMADCQLTADSKAKGLRSKTAVTIGDKFNLVSGLLEITYDSGARVILQGPVTYTVESSAGGFLSVGKLTAKVDKGSEIRDKSTDIPHPSSLIPHPLFVVRTPTATVTDLGTEFGVDVTQSGETTSHVFRGSVRVQRLSADGTAEADARILGANETVRVEGSVDNRQIVPLRTFAPSNFVRQMPKRTIKTFDLVDAVAGGDGFSGRRNAGIDPTSGRATNVPPRPSQGPNDFLVGDEKYHRTPSLPFVDGVFIPNGRRGPVRVDSAGHLFADCPETSSRTSDYVWAGGPIPDSRIRTALGEVDYASAGHRLLFVHPNKGITFDLQAIRKANPGLRLSRFRAVAGNTSLDSDWNEPLSADIWVLVDGKIRFKRRDINIYTGAMPINIPLGPDDRFLTLVATEGGNGLRSDWIIFGDPRLELLPEAP
jgi:hypothetical protein